MTAVYDKLGIQFLYPENWKLLDETDGTPHAVTLESPDGSSTWSVHVYPRDSDADDIFKETLDALQQTYDDAEITPLTETAKLIQLFKQLPSIEPDSIRAVEAMFYCLDFLIRAQLCLVATADHWLLVWTQAEDRDFDNQEIVFSAISVSLAKED